MAKKTSMTARAIGSARKQPSMRPKVAPPPAVKDTVEKVLGDMKILCKNVDEQMADKRPAVLRWETSYGHARPPVPWSSFDSERDKLLERLRKLIGWDKFSATITAALKVEFGAPPPWSRPGAFIEWVGTTAFVCDWGGYMQPHAQMLAAVPTRAWVAPGGSGGMGDIVLTSETKTVRDFFRDSLTKFTARTVYVKNKKVNTFQLQALDASGIQVATAMFKEEWVQKALVAPHTLPPIPMPDHIRTIQHAL